MRGGRVAARGEWEMGQSSRLIRPQRCSKDTAVLFLDWAGASLAIRIVSRHFFLKSPLFLVGSLFGRNLVDSLCAWLGVDDVECVAPIASASL